MAKFNINQKLEIVKKYLRSGIGAPTLSHQFNIRDKNYIYKWVNNYKAYGLKGLIVRSPKKDYPGDYKVKVLTWRNENHASYSRTALHFNLINPATICSWERKMEARGITGLYTRRGPQKMKYVPETKYKETVKHDLITTVKYQDERLKSKYSKLERAKIIHNKMLTLSLTKLLKILNIPRGTYYYHLRTTTLSKHNDNKILKQIKKIKAKPHQHNLGYRPVTAYLHASGYKINHKCVLRIMKANGLISKVYNRRKRKYNSYKGSVGHIAPDLLGRNFEAKYPYEKLTTDVSEFRYGYGYNIHNRVYLSPIMDLHSRVILAYTISKHPTVEFTLGALRSALDKRPKGLKYRTLVHSDQGFQYQNIRWQSTLHRYNAIQSMSHKGTCLDNSPMESFFHLMKDEMMNKQYKTEGQLVAAMKSWIHYYNYERIKEKLNWESPIKYQQLAI